MSTAATPGSTPSDPIAPLRRFVAGMTELVDTPRAEAEILARGSALMAELIRDDAWLPDAFAQPHPDRYCQYLLHCDPRERFSVVSFVWGPGQRTPIHDHTVWGIVGVLRGTEHVQRYARDAAGRFVPQGELLVAQRGAIETVSPAIGDVHVVSNPLTDRASISIHVYGGNIGAVRRHSFDADTGAAHDFVSGYSSDVVPNLWDRSAQVRAQA